MESSGRSTEPAHHTSLKYRLKDEIRSLRIQHNQMSCWGCNQPLLSLNRSTMTRIGYDVIGCYTINNTISHHIMDATYERVPRYRLQPTTSLRFLRFNNSWCDQVRWMTEYATLMSDNKRNYLWMCPTPGTKTISAEVRHWGRRMMMHLVWTGHGHPLEVPTVLVLVWAKQAWHPHYLW
jgi:hypothetical protein